jgi:5,10-methylene-tetrahydrofolate dehydrogenase/methenyl tetrahydrofolate cyclohydrolase
MKQTNVCIVNNSPRIGLPLFMMVNNLKGSPQLCHDQTRGLEYYVRNADIVVTATGAAGLINEVKEGATVFNISPAPELCPQVFDQAAHVITQHKYGEQRSYFGRVTVAMAALNTAHLMLWQEDRKRRHPNRNL